MARIPPGSRSSDALIFYNDFTTDFYKITHEANYSREDVEAMPWSEYKSYIKEWILNKEIG